MFLVALTNLYVNILIPCFVVLALVSLPCDRVFVSLPVMESNLVLFYENIQFGFKVTKNLVFEAI